VWHAAVTGVPLQPILGNLRLPLIPGHNDPPDHIEAVAQLARSLPTLAGADLLPYHRLGKGKRALLGQDDSEISHPPEPAQVQAWKAHFASAGLAVRLPEEL